MVLGEYWWANIWYLVFKSPLHVVGYGVTGITLRLLAAHGQPIMLGGATYARCRCCFIW